MLDCLNRFEGSDLSAGTRFPHRLVVRGAASMALTLSVGFVVDDAIVMLENIVRHMEMGKSPLRAAIEGSGEIGFTILSMTL